jgi:hypothetical protein
VIVDGVTRVRKSKVVGIDTKRLIAKANTIAAELALNVMP